MGKAVNQTIRKTIECWANIGQLQPLGIFSVGAALAAIDFKLAFNRG